MELKGKTFAFLGDSITEGVGASSESKIYHQVFKENVGLKNAFNHGIGGTRIAKQMHKSENGRWDLYFIPRVDELEDDADAVVVFGGTNDFGHGDAPLGCFADRTPDTFYGACHVLMEKLICKYPDKPIVFMTPLHRTNEDNSYAMEIPKNLSLRDYVDVIREVAEYYSIPVIDLFAESGMQPNVACQNEQYFTDGLHPNDNGHERIARKLEAFFRAFE